ncbi:MAG: hypothetical protein WD972_01680 [Candidatus Andersenbacteria bacterium]
MGRPRSEFLGAFGKLMQVFKQVADKVLELGGTDENIAAIDGDEKLAGDIALLITQRNRQVLAIEGLQNALLESAVTKLLSRVREMGGSEEDLVRLNTDPKVLDGIAHNLRGEHTIEKGCWKINFSGNRVVSVNAKGCHIRVQGLGHHAMCLRDRPFEIALSDTGITCTYIRHDQFYQEYHIF